MAEREVLRTNCHFCGYLCAFNATVEDGRVMELEPDPTRYPYDARILAGCRRTRRRQSPPATVASAVHRRRKLGFFIFLYILKSFISPFLCLCSAPFIHHRFGPVSTHARPNIRAKSLTFAFAIIVNGCDVWLLSGFWKYCCFEMPLLFYYHCLEAEPLLHYSFRFL